MVVDTRTHTHTKCIRLSLFMHPLILDKTSVCFFFFFFKQITDLCTLLQGQFSAGDEQQVMASFSMQRTQQRLVKHCVKWAIAGCYYGNASNNFCCKRYVIYCSIGPSLESTARFTHTHTQTQNHRFQNQMSHSTT